MTQTQTTSEVMTLKDVREAGWADEEGYDAPFGTFTWKHWMDAQAQINQCFSRFVRAVEEKQAAQAFLIGLEVQEIATQMLLEAYSLSAHLPQGRERNSEQHEPAENNR